jgi:pyridoxamine 5'-phosphate oxidase-like protein
MNQADVRQVLDKAISRRLLSSASLTRLGYQGRDGYPRVVPIGFLWQKDLIVVCTAANAPKVNALRERPKVGLTIDTETHPPHILLIRGTASVEIVDGVPAEYLEASRKTMDADQFRGFEQQVRGTYDQMARISIRPEWAKLIDFETTMPQAVEEILRRKTA